MAKRSPIWEYFEVASNERFAICKLCNKSVARSGKDKKSYTTTNVVKHLESCNRSKYPEYLKNKEDEDAKRKEIRQAKPLRQIILEESQDRVKVWDINDPRAKKTHQLIGEMIALDTQPFSIVEDVGFTCLLHCLEPRYQLPSCPVVRALARYLDKHDNDSGVRTMKSEMLDSLNRRFENMENEEFLLLSTALDPRYKDKFFTTNSVHSEAKRILEQNCAIENHDEPPAKRPHTEQEGSKNTSDLWTCFSEILEESGIDEIQTSDEVDRYLGECLIDFKKGNSYLWWNQNKERSPKL